MRNDRYGSLDGIKGFALIGIIWYHLSQRSLPGGFIAVHSGLLLAAQTESELASVLGHEIGHVALGDRWFRHFCAERGLEPEATYLALMADFDAPWPPRPLNVEARRRAGFSAAEIARLEAGRRGG